MLDSGLRVQILRTVEKIIQYAIEREKIFAGLGIKKQAFWQLQQELSVLADDQAKWALLQEKANKQHADFELKQLYTAIIKHDLPALLKLETDLKPTVKICVTEKTVIKKAEVPIAAESHVVPGSSGGKSGLFKVRVADEEPNESLAPSSEYLLTGN